MKEDIIFYGKLTSFLDRCKEVIFSKSDCFFVFRKENGIWKFGNATFEVSELVKLIVKAQDEGFKVFMN